MMQSKYTKQAISERSLYWRDQLSAWSTSGLTQKEFCRQRGISRASFTRWKKRIEQRMRGLIPDELIPVEVVDAPRESTAIRPAQDLEVVLPSGLCIRVPTDFQPQALQRLVQTLEEL